MHTRGKSYCTLTMKYLKGKDSNLPEPTHQNIPVNILPSLKREDMARFYKNLFNAHPRMCFAALKVEISEKAKICKAYLRRDFLSLFIYFL